MKTKQLFTWLLFAHCFMVQAQTSDVGNLPFVQDDKTWEAQVGLIMENLYGNRIDGDTLIGGEIWKKVYNYFAFPDFNYSYYVAIRDVGKKVYAIAKGSNRPRLLYDFGLKVGNTVKCGIEGNAFGCLLDKDEQPDTLLGFEFVAYLRVERIDTIEARGLRHRRFTLTLLDSFRERMVDNIVWVEGVGSGAGPFSPWMPLPPLDSFLQSCNIGRNCIFGYPDFYDADLTDAVGNAHENKNEINRIYGLQGYGLQTPQRDGLYIRGGKKFIYR